MRTDDEGNNEDKYEYIPLGDVQENTDQEPQQSSNAQEHSTSSRLCQHETLPSASTDGTSQAMDSLMLPIRQIGDCNSSSGSSSSEGYLRPISTEYGRDSDGNGYDYADVEVSINRPSNYIELEPRPPPIPNVYDRLRQSRIIMDP